MAVFEKTAYEDIFGIPQLKILRFMLCKSVFTKLMEELTLSIRCEVIESS